MQQFNDVPEELGLCGESLETFLSMVKGPSWDPGGETAFMEMWLPPKPRKFHLLDGIGPVNA